MFSKIRFLHVDSIRLTHWYGDTNRELPATLSARDAYIDEQSAKFYILKNFENSEMRYIRTMAEFLVDNADGQSKLISFIEELVRSYQRNPKQGLNTYRIALKNSYEPKWCIPKEIVEEQQVEKKQQEPKKPIEISEEEIRALAAEEPIGPKPVEKTTEDTTKQVSKTSQLLQLPSEGGDRNAHGNSNSTERKVSSENFISHSLNSPKPPNPQHEKSETDENTANPNSKPAPEHLPPRSMPDSMPLPRNDLAEKVQSIVIKNLNDLDFSLFASTTNKAISIPNFDTDGHAGRVGEQIVFQVLKREYSTAKVTWENEITESMSPYDICIEHENGEKEFIEVKTTRLQNENSFFVSGQEVKFFLDHPENSSIYRVYHADPIESSTITQINRIKDNLDTQNLKLVMTLFSKPNQSS
ncbi:unnamed protein product [Rotaria sp. Silwood2]|nr:unnamed protein product [Rotaria sp. Silwood2]CAF2724907.1 unnamed protein product [Rotaria sp. Silwood2]CAF4199787.1 unnamed protein product [Rotaria sp. Silwood2]CAF4290408.1 unnamed protein product [Rotaria sp. Silwood2]CAF4305521.1 unnamed protein product [Rotaria sp. Silwood2]